MLKPARGNIEETIYSSHGIVYGPSVAKNILFLHAISGCDTTSALFNQGKVKSLKVVEQSDSLADTIQIFQDPNADSRAIVDAGETFLLALYGGGKDQDTLDSLRFQHFVRAVSKNTFNLASLPPTRDAATQHILRTYHQVQSWCGVEKNPQEYGWQRTTTGLDLIRTTKAPAPDALLKSISCKCQKGCGAACGCRKTGLKCSVLCRYCNGDLCENTAEILDDDDCNMEDDADNVLSINTILGDPTCDSDSDNQTTSSQLPKPKRQKK